MDRLLILEPSNVVAIRVESGQKCTGRITLRNVMYTMPVAFSFHPKDRIHYTVVPQSGIIPPLKTVTLEITYHLPQTDSILPRCFPHCDDQFTLQSVVAPGAAAALKDSSSSSVPGEWFTNRRKQVYSEDGIQVMFVGSLVLAWLMEKGRMDEIREVLEKSDPAWKSADAVDSDGRSLLHLAINQGRPDLVQLLIEFHVDIEARDVSGSSPLEAAVAGGESLIVELLLAHKANTERSASAARGPVHLAAGNGDFEVLGLLLKKGAKVNALTLDGYTALHLAVMERRRDCVRMLLANNARADIQNANTGDTPLHEAASHGDEAMVKLLLSKGSSAIKYVRNKAGKTAYDLAAESGHGKLFDALKLGDRLCTAARRGDVRTIERLIDGGAAVNGRDQNGWTALHRAAFKGRVEAARALIAKGADIDAKDGDGYTALHCAVEAGQAEVAELLVKKGADVEAATNKGTTAEGIAEAMEYPGIVRILAGGGSVVRKESLDKQSGGGDRRRRLRRRSIGESTALAVV